jgi:Tol biopolymer transport system component
MNEGLAEYAALTWDTNSDMFIRDAAIHNYLPPVEYLGGYFAYRGGQSVWHYIATTYGEPKISEILHRMRGSRSIDQGFKSTIGLTVRELSERWEKEMKVIYWPDIAKREEPEDFAHKRFTDHTKTQNFYNTSPAISPQGDRFVFLSDRDDFLDVYLASAIDGEIFEKLIDGQRSSDFEELHLLTPGLTWSPDGKRIALATKAGARDAVIVVEIESGDRTKIDIPLDGVFSVSWSHDGKYLTFAGIKTPQSDIYVFEIETSTLTNLTQDIFSDYDPSFSADGSKIYFVSDRGRYVDPNDVPASFRMSKFDFNQKDIYEIDVASRKIRRITNDQISDETSPIASPDGKELLYISDRNGLNNIYVKNLETGDDRPITNSISGVYQLTLSADGSKLLFTSLSEGGFDVYLLLRPLDRKLSVTSLELTEFRKQQLGVPLDEKPREIKDAVVSSDTVAVRDNLVILSDTSGTEQPYRSNVRVDMKSYVFSEDKIRRDTLNVPPSLTTFTVPDSKDTEGNYIPRRYKLNFTPDLVYGSAGYNTLFGLEGSTVMAFSDMLGDHRIIFQTNLLLDLSNSDYGLTYLYLPSRIDYGFSGFHSARFLFFNDTLFRYRMWGIGGAATYPIDRFQRLDLNLMWLNTSRDDLDNAGSPSQRRSFVLPTLSYIRDNSLWRGGWFGPNNGSRFNFTFYGSPKLSDDTPDLQTFMVDYRSYHKVGQDFVFAWRGTAGLSIGEDRQHFFIGGTEGWINRRFDGGSIPIESIEDYTFLTPVYPLRGYNYNALNGTQYALFNAEFRFPLIRYLIFGALPIGFQNILGAAFIDVGSAWSNPSKWKGFERNSSNFIVTKDLLMGTGIGTRLVFFGMPLRIDVAWRFNWHGFSEPVYYFSLGPDY